MRYAHIRDAVSKGACPRSGLEQAAHLRPSRSAIFPILDLPVDWKVCPSVVGVTHQREIEMEVREGDTHRCPIEGCGCEITVSSAPEMEATQNFIDCCGHEMEMVQR